MEDIQKLTEFAEKTYHKGCYFITAYTKYLNSREPSKNVSNKIEVFQLYGTKFKQYAPQDFLNENIIALLEFDTPGLIYIQGFWADICDEDGNIILVINGENPEIEKFRTWLYTEDNDKS